MPRTDDEPGRVVVEPRTVAAVSAETVCVSKTLARFLDLLFARPAAEVVDLGPVIGSNITFLGERVGCKIHVEDLFSDIDRHVQNDKLDQLPEFLGGRFSVPASSIDAVLGWDIFDYPRPDGRDRPGRRADADTTAGRVFLGFFGARASDDPRYTKYSHRGRDAPSVSLLPFRVQPAMGSAEPRHQHHVRRPGDLRDGAVEVRRPRDPLPQAHPELTGPAWRPSWARPIRFLTSPTRRLAAIPRRRLRRPAKAERRIDRRQRSPEEEPSREPRQEGRSQDQRDRRLRHPLHDRIAAALPQQHALSAELEAMQGAHVGLAQPLDLLQDVAPDRAVAEVRVEHLRGHRGGRERDVDADGAGRAHRVGGVADQQQPVARPLAASGE